MKLLVRTTAPSGSFHRAGRAWTRDGIILSQDDLSPEVWKVLQAEPLIHIAPAPDDAEVAAAEAGDLAARIREAIARLGDEDFGQDGVPLLEAVRKQLPEGSPAISKKLVTEVWAALKEEAARQ